MKHLNHKKRTQAKLMLSVLLVFLGFLYSQAQGDQSLINSTDPMAPNGITSTEQPRQLQGVGITENLGAAIDWSLKFKDENGADVTLRKYYDGTHPVVISMVYFACPGLCNFHLNGVVDSLKPMDWSAGQKFQYVAISMDTSEKPRDALAKKATYMKQYNRPGTENGWHFLTGDDANVKALTNSIGFKYKWNPESKDWAHASAAVVTTPKGTISRYLHGILIETETFRMALNEATEGKTGTFVDKMIWYCFHYDTHKSKYTVYAFRLVQLGGILIIVILGLLLTPNWLRSRRLKVKSKTEKLS